jgi:aryl-alcohol dehydrogenase
MQITAAVLRDRAGAFALETVEQREPEHGEVRVRIAGAGICHTDELPRTDALPIPLPVIAGHEGSGVVEAVGPGTSLAVGDHVVLSFDSCRTCDNCVDGHPSYCATFFERNLFGTGLVETGHDVRDAGGEPVAARWFGQSSFASHALVAERNAVKVDADLPIELLGPLGCGVQTGAASILEALRVRAGSSVIVSGVGAVGLSAVMAARVAGAATIVAVDINPARLELATELGATATVDGRTDDLTAALLAATGGAQYGLDTTGLPPVATAVLRALRPTGTLGLVGVQQGPISLEPMDLSVGRNVMGILEGDAVPQTFLPRLISLWREGRFPFDRLVRTYPLAEINEAERAALAGEVVKPVLVP